MKRYLIAIIMLLLFALPKPSFSLQSFTLENLKFSEGTKIPSDEKIIINGNIGDRRTKILIIEYASDGIPRKVEAQIDSNFDFTAVAGPFKKDTMIFFDFYKYTSLDFNETAEVEKELNDVLDNIKINFALRYNEVYSSEQFAFQIKKLLLKIKQFDLYLTTERKLYDEILEKMTTYSGVLIKYGFAVENKELTAFEIKQTSQKFIDYNNNFFEIVSDEDTPLKAELRQLETEMKTIADIRTLSYKVNYFISKILKENKSLSSIRNEITHKLIFQQNYFDTVKSYDEDLKSLTKDYVNLLKIINRVQELKDNLLKISKTAYTVSKVSSYAKVKGAKEIAYFNLNYLYSPDLQDIASFITMNLHAKRAVSEIYDLPLYSIYRLSLSLGRSVEAFGDGDNLVEQPIYYIGVNYNINEYFSISLGNIMYENNDTGNKMKSKFALGAGIDIRIIGEVLKRFSVSF